MLALTVVVLLLGLGVAGHRLAEYEWPWHRAPGTGAEERSPRTPWPVDLLGASRTLLPEVAKGSSQGGDRVVSEFIGADPKRDEWPDYTAAIPDGCEDLTDEDVPIDTAPESERDADGVDLEEYLDKLDELALRVSYLVTGQLKNELVPALREWINLSGLAGDQNLNAVLATTPPDWDEEEIAAKNRYFLQLYEQAINQPD
jgi:hypothetical protein